MKGALSCLTFIQPVREAIKHSSFLPGGNQADHSALHRRSVVNVVFKNKDLDRGTQNSVVILLEPDLKRSPHVHSLFLLRIISMNLNNLLEENLRCGSKIEDDKMN